jgi:probable F420-dependent oxidoreductase
MRFGLILPHFRHVAGKTLIRDVAQAAEALGFDSIWVTDRAAVPAAQRRSFGPGFYDPLVTLGYVAAQTTRVRLGASVFVLPYRQPVLLARALASIDQLCDGRLDVGVGAGWMREEFAAIGVPFERRGALTDEYIEAMLAIWAAPLASFAGPTVRFEQLSGEPLPLQRPHPPLWVGGSTPPALRRAVRYGDVWHGSPTPLPALEQIVAALRDECLAQGRAPQSLPVTTRGALAFAKRAAGFGAAAVPDEPVGTPDEVAAAIHRYAALGFSELVFDTFFEHPALDDATPASVLQTIQTFARAVLPAFAPRRIAPDSGPKGRE